MALFESGGHLLPGTQDSADMHVMPDALGRHVAGARESERDREIQRERDRERQTEREREKGRDCMKERQRDREGEIWKEELERRTT